MKYVQMTIVVLLSFAFSSASFALGTCEINYEYMTQKLPFAPLIPHRLPITNLGPDITIENCLSESISNLKSYYERYKSRDLKKFANISTVFIPSVERNSVDGQNVGPHEATTIQLEPRAINSAISCQGEALDPSTLRGFGGIATQLNPHRIYYIQESPGHQDSKYPKTLNECIQTVFDLFQEDRNAGRQVGSRIKVEFTGTLDGRSDSQTFKAEIVTNPDNQ